jgi:toxin ParE1/3/4
VTVKPVIPRLRARTDAEAAIDYYRSEAGTDVALRFVAALEAAYVVIGVRPKSGSLRFAHELDVEGLRSRKVGRFPYLLFYMERADHVEVWRILHARRDIPAWIDSRDPA